MKLCVLCESVLAVPNTKDFWRNSKPGTLNEYLWSSCKSMTIMIDWLLCFSTWLLWTHWNVLYIVHMSQNPLLLYPVPRIDCCTFSMLMVLCCSPFVTPLKLTSGTNPVSYHSCSHILLSIKLELNFSLKRQNFLMYLHLLISFFLSSSMVFLPWTMFSFCAILLLPLEGKN